MVACRPCVSVPAGWRLKAAATLRMASIRASPSAQSPSTWLTLRLRPARSGWCGASSSAVSGGGSAGRLMDGLAQALIGIDDPRDEIAAHDVGGREADGL